MGNITQTSAADAPTFEQARQAVWTLRALRGKLSPAERETLALMIDQDAMETILESKQQAENGELEPLEDAVRTPV